MANRSTHQRRLLDVTVIGAGQQEENARPKPGLSRPRHEDTPHFVHEPIKSSNTIRLFHLSPGHFWDDLNGSFEEFQLKSTATRSSKVANPDEFLDFTIKDLWPPADDKAEESATEEMSSLELDYLAISYTWVSDDAKSNIDGEAVWLNNASHSIPITHNLSRCLRRIRSKTETQRLWIDQLCINQDSSGIRDKEQQIPLMGKIYSQARGVLLWVGEHIDGSDTAATFDLIRLLHVAFQDLPLPNEKHFERLQSCTFSTFRRDHGLPHEDSPAWRGYYRFCQRRVFTRLWIVQEVCLARRLGVLCADHLMDFRMLGESQDFMIHSGLDRAMAYRAMASLHRHDDVFGVSNRPGSGFRSRTYDFFVSLLWRRRCSSLMGVAQSLSFLLVEPSVFSTDRDFKQDKIYALLGLVVEELENDGSIPEALSPDYSKPYEQVVRDAVEWLLTRESADFLDVLSLVVYRPNGSAQAGPSWIPDLMAKGSFTLQITHAITEASSKRFDAPIASPRASFIGKPPEIAGDSLTLDAFRINRIIATCPFDIDEISFECWLDQIATTVDSLSFLGVPYAVGNDVDPIDALWRTMIRASAALEESDTCRRRFFHMVVRYSVDTVVSSALDRLGIKYGIHRDQVAEMASNTPAIETELRLLLRGPAGHDEIDNEQSFTTSFSGLPGPFKVSSRAIKDLLPGLWKLLYENIFPRFGRVGLRKSGYYMPYLNLLSRSSNNYSFFITEEGLFGLGPLSVQEGDEVYMLRGGKMPYVLREKRVPGESGHILIGESYVYGSVRGEECERFGLTWERMKII